MALTLAEVYGVEVDPVELHTYRPGCLNHRHVDLYFLTRKCFCTQCEAVTVLPHTWSCSATALTFVPDMGAYDFSPVPSLSR